jgi:Mlc titration factor MtfA (ptsG expression regulator)
MDVRIEPWTDEHGVVWELVQMGLDETGGGCIIRECRSSLDVADGDDREGVEVIARFGDVEDGRNFLREEGFQGPGDPVW